MFVKLIILILVVGSSGVGVLSVRQSRLQAAHETAEARLRILKLINQTTELKSEIALYATPERLAVLLSNEKGYAPAVHHPAMLDALVDHPEDARPDGMPDVWILEDGTRIYAADLKDLIP